MGVTISSKHYSIDMGYGGFVRLRRTIASLCPKEIADHYNLLLNSLHRFLCHPEESDAYDRETDKLFEKYKQYRKVVNNPD